MGLRVRVDHRACPYCLGRGTKRLDPGHQTLLDVCRDLASAKVVITAQRVWLAYRDAPGRTNWPARRRKLHPVSTLDLTRTVPTTSLHNMLADLVRFGFITKRKGVRARGRQFTTFYTLAKR